MQKHGPEIDQNSPQVLTFERFSAFSNEFPRKQVRDRCWQHYMCVGAA
jgi:hypothetical protein